MRLIGITLLLMGIQPAAYAYIGPGLGAGALGVVLGLLASIFLALFALFWYPVKRLLKKRRAARLKRESPAAGSNPTPDSADSQ